MVSANILFPQFRDEQADSKYPFADQATLVSNSGTVTLAKDVFIDACFYPVGGGQVAYLSSIQITNTKVTMTITTVNPRVVVTAEYDPLNGRPAGLLVFNADKLLEIYQWGAGTYTFSPTATEFVPTAVIPANEPGVRALTLNDAHFLTGDTWIVGRDGVVVTAEGNNVIRVDIVGVPLFNRAACDNAAQQPALQSFVSTINGCPPDEFGNFLITATNQNVPNDDTTVLRIYPAEYGLILEAVGRSNV
jgi:hypothetical protein